MWPNPQSFTEEILNGKLHFLCSKTTKQDFLTHFTLIFPFYIPWKCYKTAGHVDHCTKMFPSDLVRFIEEILNRKTSFFFALWYDVIVNSK